MLPCLWFGLLFCRFSAGQKEIDVSYLAKSPDNGPDLLALEERKSAGSDYADLPPLKTQPDKTSFEFTISFYADAAHFGEDPASLEKELNQIIKHLDSFMETLQPMVTVKLNYKLKVFPPGDQDRIEYDYKAKDIFNPDTWKKMVDNKLLKDDHADVLFLLVPHDPDVRIWPESTPDPVNRDGVEGHVMPQKYRELGIGMAKVYTKQWMKNTLLIKTGSGYKWRNAQYLCVAKKECKPRAPAMDPTAPLYMYPVEVMEVAGELGKEDNPSPEVVEAYLQKNLTGHQIRWIGTTAHELGHLMGARERGLIHGADDAKMAHDVMSNPTAYGYGDTSRYIIYMYLACDIWLPESTDFRSKDLNTRSCKVSGTEGRDFARRLPLDQRVNNDVTDNKRMGGSSSGGRIMMGGGSSDGRIMMGGGSSDGRIMMGGGSSDGRIMMGGGSSDGRIMMGGGSMSGGSGRMIVMSGDSMRGGGNRMMSMNSMDSNDDMMGGGSMSRGSRAPMSSMDSSDGMKMGGSGGSMSGGHDGMMMSGSGGGSMSGGNMRSGGSMSGGSMNGGSMSGGHDGMMMMGNSGSMMGHGGSDYMDGDDDSEPAEVPKPGKIPKPGKVPGPGKVPSDKTISSGDKPSSVSTPSPASTKEAKKQAKNKLYLVSVKNKQTGKSRKVLFKDDEGSTKTKQGKTRRT